MGDRRILCQGLFERGPDGIDIADPLGARLFPAVRAARMGAHFATLGTFIPPVWPSGAHS